MSEPFIKLNMWMASELNLSGNELIIFAVIHQYTAYQGGYDRGMNGLTDWTGCARSKAYEAVNRLIDKGLVERSSASKGRNPTVYRSKVNRPETGRFWDGKPSQNGTVNRPETGHLIDSIDSIDNTPYNPPKRGTERKPYRPRRKNPALNYDQGGSYDKETLKQQYGISFGEEFYE